MSADAVVDRKSNPRQAGGYLGWIGAAGIVTVAVMRCVIAFLPQTIFDVDPASEQALVIASLGMGGSLALDAALILACLFALLGEWRAGRGIDPVLLILALTPLPIVWWHGSSDAGDLWRGSTWLAAAIACVTIAHLARQRVLRIVITAALVAVIVPLLARGVTQMTYEHDDMLADYRQNKTVYLQQRGWEEDSPAARIFERRLSHREPTGWFTSTNIFGSIAGCCAIVCAALALIAVRAKMQSGWWFLMLLVAVACAAALWVTSSMGAVLVTIGGAVMLCLVSWWLNRGERSVGANPGQARGYVGRERRGGWIGALLVVMIFGATFGVILRGVILPEGFAGEKSLLFRWHYLQAAAGVVSEHPVTGVGPDGFQVAYMRHRVPRNPEEVQSAHAMFTDWVSMLGVLGGTWVGLIIAMAVRAGAAMARPVGQESSEAPTRVVLNFALCVAALGLVPAILIEWQALVPSDSFVRALAIVGYVTASVMFAMVLNQCDDRWLRGTSIAAAAVLLVHGQIEMTFFQGGSVVWGMAMVGLIGEARPVRSRGLNVLVGVVVTLALAVWLAWLIWSGVLPAFAQEREMLDAARLLDQVRNEPDNREIALIQRPLAAKRLVDAYERWPINVQPLNAAADQLFIASAPPRVSATTAPATSPATGAPMQPTAGPALGLLMDSADLIDRAVIEHNKPSSLALARTIHTTLAALTDDSRQWAAAILVSRRLADGDPHGVQPWQRLGDVLWQAGEKHEAARAYRTALTNSDNFSLDELKQLSPRVRSVIERRIREAGE